ncbi:mandelate racemase/muconate lactonizing enzyme family protein [Pelagibius litoralis]|uniref:Mandelate racemase/muconate lactonizing enzyme family protein n=1 Tax=Pelagibius litoralis TaxID=374515 RepID=A0A967F1Q7_9PROT|nr:mandelate racemase/muconate lactonizing enzyme family protein [Pelagibius litoralis]NIA71331.1 mandelate racemase/muconate lactonizing enzyme family protein [Pelagibius litoralis]
MSFVANIRVHTHCNDLSGKFWNPAIRWTKKYVVFVEVEDGAGRIGLGECWCFDTAPDTLCAYLKTEVIPAFLGRELSSLEEILTTLWTRATLTARHGLLASAMSGLDIAMHDLRAQSQQRPIWRSMNDTAAGHVRLYASGGLYGQGKGLPELAREVAGMSQAGFSIVKMKIGGLDFEADLERVRQALDVLPSTSRLIIDAVYSLTPVEALRFFEALPTERIEAFQSPLPAEDIAGMARLVRAGVPVMATEAEYRREVHARLVEERAVSFLQTAPIACGGFGRLTELADLVRETEIRLSLEVSSTAVALMAACHFAAADETVAHVEYHHLHQVFFDRLPWSGTEFGSQMPLPDRPGLGISLPQDGTEFAFELSNSPEEDAVA